jgi:hypothetical protein
MIAASLPAGIADVSTQVAPTASFFTPTNVLFASNIVSQLSGMYSAYQSGKIAEITAKMRADAIRFNARMNARIAERNAEIIQQRAKFQEAKKRKQTSRLLGQIKSLYGKAGVAMKGTPELVLEDVAIQEEIDAMAIRVGGFIDTQNARLEASNERLRGRLADIQEAVSIATAKTGTITNILKSAADILSLTEEAQRKGII